MKADKTYSHINVCPKTNDTMSSNDINNSSGVCPYCGDINDFSFTHSEKVAGRWVRPTIFERIFSRKRTEFLAKEEEDNVWDGLQQ